MKPAERASIIVDRKQKSLLWLQDNYYPQWESTYKAYKCERDPEKDADGKVDKTQTSVSMPDTWAHVRRTVARATAQPPHIKFRADDPKMAELISRTIMYQWDKARIQRIQKRHMTQAVLTG